MSKKIGLIFQICTIFIGTIVGAGLASGQEIKQFFTSYGYRSFIGIIICGIIYACIGSMIIKLSIQYNLHSYNDLITLVSPGILGNATDILTSIFLISSSAIILAGSGSLLYQYFHVSKWIGICLMLFISLLTLIKDTKGLIEINSFIVPSLIIIIISLFILYLWFCKDIIIVNSIKAIPYYKKNWLLSCFLYGGFNILTCSGVLVPISNEVKQDGVLISGLIIGAIILTVLEICINFMLLLNVPYIYKYDIPLLYIADRFGNLIQIMLLGIIFLEMFSTEVSDVYSVAKTLEQKFKIPYKKGVLIVLISALPISQIGFVKLISFLYPAFGCISIIFMIQITLFYIKHR